jgi:hypothetical protein
LIFFYLFLKETYLYKYWLEYKAEEVLRGDLRYSKLLGAQQNVTEEQWEHVTYTKRGRRSIQRHTFMMGSHCKLI